MVERALRYLRGRFQLIVTDLVMPDLEGLGFIIEVRKLHPSVPIIAISGRFEGDFLGVALRLGANAAIGKPFSPQEFLECINSVLPRE